MASAMPSEMQRLSDLIGDIYDCVLDPDRWDDTLGDLHRFLDLENCLLYVLDSRSRTFRMQKAVGIEPAQLARMADFATDVTEGIAHIPDLMTRPLDEPFAIRRDVSDEVTFANRYFLEWAKPQGLIDTLFMHLMRGPQRTAEIAMGRHQRFGVVGEREIGLMRLISPHLRRAINISDLIEMKSLKAIALGEAMDAMAVGIVLVAADAGIVHANRRAERMLAEGWPIRSAEGRLSAGDPGARDRLRRVIALAARKDTEIGAAGIGMALASPDLGVATAHVLPLAGGDLRTRLAPRAVAAVFISSETSRATVALDGVAETFSLTPAETRLLGRLAMGDSIDAAAKALGVARPTVKTHLARILSKTGSRRQADLVALVHRLVPPTGAGDGDARA